MKVLISVLTTAVLASAAAPVCGEYYSKGEVVKSTVKETSKLSLKDILKNEKGEIVKAKFEITAEVKPETSALKLSDIIRQLDAKGVIADSLTIDVTTNLVLSGKGVLYGIEVDVTPMESKTTMTINLEQNVAKIAEGQTFVNILNQKTANESIMVKLSGEVKEMDKKAKPPEEQRCKGA